jgi:hypothetical protein
VAAAPEPAACSECARHRGHLGPPGPSSRDAYWAAPAACEHPTATDEDERARMGRVCMMLCGQISVVCRAAPTEEDGFNTQARTLRGQTKHHTSPWFIHGNFVSSRVRLSRLRTAAFLVWALGIRWLCASLVPRSRLSVAGSAFCRSSFTPSGWHAFSTALIQGTTPSAAIRLTHLLTRDCCVPS